MIVHNVDKERRGCRSTAPFRWVMIGALALLVVSMLGCGGGGGGSSSDAVAPEPGTVSFSGSVVAPDGVVIDSDVNDPNEDYQPNDSVATAQPLANPVSVGGYVNVAGSGAPGRSFSLGDRNDYFSVRLSAGDRIALVIGDPDAGEPDGPDLELYLYDTSGTMIEGSINVGRYESITFPPPSHPDLPDDTYVVNVYADAGASNYILSVGTDLDEAAGSPLSTQYDFVPDQAIVRFTNTLQAAADRFTALGLARAAGAADREVLLTFDAQALQADGLKALGAAGRRPSKTAAADSELARKLSTLRVIKALRKRADVLSADPNYILRHYATEPDDEYYHLQWHYPQISLPRAWGLIADSSEVVASGEVIVAVVDTGVLMDHPDLEGHLTDTGYDFISNAGVSNDGDGIDPDPDDPGDGVIVGSSSFHGTHCAGTVAASSNNAVGVAGASWNSDTRIMPIRVLGVGGGTEYDILQGVRYAAGLENDSGIRLSADQRADIISMSLGGEGSSSASQAVYTAARQAGVILIAAAGNQSTATPSYPASYGGVISVSAVNINGTLASYSNYGSHIDVAAPGGDFGDYNGDGYADRVWSTCGDDAGGDIQFTYAAYKGTSMAAPHVAGVAALMKAVLPAMTPDELDLLLADGSIITDIGGSGWDSLYGHGLIDAYKAVAAASSGSIPAALIVSPTIVNLGTLAGSATLTVSKIGSEAIAVAGFSPMPEPWLTVSEDSVDADGLGTYTVTADRGYFEDEALSDGTYSAAVTFTASSGGIVSVPVNLQVRTTSASADAGFHYVLLADPDTLAVVQQDAVRALNGSYDYAFDDVPAGARYLIVAGSDRDNDGFIDNAGESLGAYLSLDQITYVDADGDQAGLDFLTDLRLTVFASDLSTGSLDADGPQYMRLW